MTDKEYQPKAEDIDPSDVPTAEEQSAKDAREL